MVAPLTIMRSLEDEQRGLCDPLHLDIIFTDIRKSMEVGLSRFGNCRASLPQKTKGQCI